MNKVQVMMGYLGMITNVGPRSPYDLNPLRMLVPSARQRKRPCTNCNTNHVHNNAFCSSECSATFKLNFQAKGGRNVLRDGE